MFRVGVGDCLFDFDAHPLLNATQQSRARTRGNINWKRLVGGYAPNTKDKTAALDFTDSRPGLHHALVGGKKHAFTEEVQGRRKHVWAGVGCLG